MTEEIGIRELKANMSEVLRRVREEKATYDVTYRGRVVAHLVPVDDKEFDRAEFEKLWAEMDELAAEISATWPTGVTAAQAIDEERR